jgi:hypothetical protein
MTRTLVFDTSDLSKKRFETVFRGLIIMGNQNTQKGLSVLTRELAVLDKLEAISAPCNCGRMVTGTKEPDRELVDMATTAPLTVTIDEQEFDMLYQYVSLVPWSIGESSRNAIRVLAWLQDPDRA